uniref:Phosphatases II n=1 Tax=Mycena chlorophos TaxID=658473 RepID=A0ABQ0M9D3_MYCCL|nr:predicted protein [Mycena chlorophos]
MDIAPYDRTLVTFGSERYLNADWCLERYGKKYWIAAQATLPHTSHAFLSLLTAPISIPNGPSTRIRTVVQLTQLVENGRRKADAYFPSEVGQAVLQRPEPGYSGPPIVATLVERVDLPEACCIKSTVSLSFQDSNEAAACCIKSTVSLSFQDSNEAAVRFQHLLFTSWPDHGVPELQEQKHLMEFIQLVDKTNRNSSDDPDPPIVVGCSAGVGRTGTFIAVSSLLRAHGFLPPPSHPSTLDLVSPLGPLPHEEDEVAQEVDWLREQRPGMVQQQSQLELIYSLLESAFATEI